MTFLSPDQILEELFVDLIAHPEDFDAFVEVPTEQLIGLHHGYGRWIRNHYKLWDSNNPYSMLDYQPELIDEVDHNKKHPDSISMRIIEKLHQRCVEYKNSNKDLPLFPTD